MEVNLGGDEPEQGGGGGEYDIDKIMSNPQVQGVLSAIMQKNDVNPEQFGLPAPAGDSEMQDTDPDESRDLDATKLNNLLGKIIAIKGDDLTLGEMQEMVQTNPEQVNTLLQQHL